MSEEIERKFLVTKTPVDLKSYKSQEIEQGYIIAEEQLEIRVRRKGDKFFQTIKGSGDLKRSEIEIELSENQFNTLWPLTEGKRVEKRRYEIPYNNIIIEVDIYSGTLAGLIVAEVEFSSEEESKLFSPPNWFGKEITTDKRYKNKNLSLNRFPI